MPASPSSQSAQTCTPSPQSHRHRLHHRATRRLPQSAQILKTATARAACIASVIAQPAARPSPPWPRSARGCAAPRPSRTAGEDDGRPTRDCTVGVSHWPGKLNFKRWHSCVRRTLYKRLSTAVSLCCSFTDRSVKQAILATGLARAARPRSIPTTSDALVQAADGILPLNAFRGFGLRSAPSARKG